MRPRDPLGRWVPESPVLSGPTGLASRPPERVVLDRGSELRPKVESCPVPSHVGLGLDNTVDTIRRGARGLLQSLFPETILEPGSLPPGMGERARMTGEETLTLCGEERSFLSPDSPWVAEGMAAPRRMSPPQTLALPDLGDHSVGRAREVCRPPDARSPGGPARLVGHKTSTTVVQRGLQKTWRQTTIQQAFGQDSRLCEFGPLPSTTGHSRQNWHPGGSQAMSRSHPYRCVAQRLGCYHGRGEQSCPDGQDGHPSLQLSPGRNYGMLPPAESHRALSGQGCVLAQGTTRPGGTVSPAVLPVSAGLGPSRGGRTQRMLVPGDVTASAGEATAGSSRSECALPDRRPVDGASRVQGRPLGSLDAHKARRLAQGFDENSVEVMLQARKSSTNATICTG